MKQSPKKYDIKQCALYKCRSKKRLELLLTLEAGDLRLINSLIQYHKFKIDKKGTTEKRDITAPNKDLKQIQARILRLIQYIERPIWLISGEKGKCYIDNGKAHRNSNYALAVDIRKFYDNCKREPVYRFFGDFLKTSADVAKILTDIVTYDHGIPTGCPTSQLIAYYAYRAMFDEISSIAEQAGCIFTLYVDDMTFSSDVPFNYKSLANQVDIILRKYGHKPKYKKVRYYSKNDFKPITGTIVTSEHTLTVPNSLQKKIYDGFQMVKDLADDSLTLEHASKLTTLRGQLQAAKNIQPDKFPQINQIISKKKIMVTEKHAHTRKSRKAKKNKIVLSKKLHKIST